jgi:hypothetical protein
MTWKMFVLRNLQQVIFPIVLFGIAIITLPFAFVTDSRESLIELKSKFSDIKLVRGSTTEENTFELRLHDMAQVFIIERMRVADQTLFTAKERVGSEVTLVVEAQKLRNPTLVHIPVVGISTPNSIYIKSDNLAELMQKGRYLAGFVCVASLFLGIILARNLRRGPIATDGFDPWSVWIARNTLLFVRWLAFTTFIVLALVLPSGTWLYTLIAVIVAYGALHFWFKAKGTSVEWIRQIIEWDNQHIASQTRVTTEKPTYIQILEPILRSGVDINLLDKNGQNLLHVAAAKGSSEEVDYLLRNGSQPNVPDSHGQTALMLAGKAKSLGACTKLLEKGANPMLVDEAGQTARTIVETSSKLPALILLLTRAETTAKAKAAEAVVADIIAKLESAGKADEGDKQG